MLICIFTETVLSIYIFDRRFLAILLSITTTENSVLYLVSYYSSDKCGSLHFKIVGVRKQSPTADAKGFVSVAATTGTSTYISPNSSHVV